jgi:hypothetical protein
MLRNGPSILNKKLNSPSRSDKTTSTKIDTVSLNHESPGASYHGRCPEEMNVTYAFVLDVSDGRYDEAGGVFKASNR